MTRRLWRSRAVRVALAAFVAALAILTWSVWQAARLDDAGASTRVAGGIGAQHAALPHVAPEGYSLERVLAAVAKDPFHPERRRPGARFRLPTEARVARRPETRVPETSIRLVGTAVAPDGGFAMCAWQGGTPRIVRVGDRVGEWTLKKVTPGAAEFTTPAGATVVVRAPQARRGGGE